MTEDVKEKFVDAFFESQYSNQATNYMYDIATTWPVIVVASVVAVILSYLYLFMVRCMGGMIIWFSIIVSFLILTAAGFYAYFFGANEFEVTDPTHEYVKYAAYVSWGLAGVILLAVCCCFNAIQLGIAVFKTTAQYIQATMEIFILPFLSFVICFIWFTIWLGSAVFIFSVGTPEPREEFPAVTEMKWNKYTRWVLFYHVFALFWINAYIIGSTQFIIGASTCMWYFTCKTDTKGKGTLPKAAWWWFRYHWATVAFGALIIAICQMIRLLFEYYRKKMGAADKTIPWIKVLFCLTRYCLWCMEKCVKYISKNAYIQCALTNDSFIPAALNAFTLILKNCHRFGMTNTIGSIFMFFGCFLNAGLTCFGTYMFLVNYDGFEITSPIPTTVVMAVVAVAVGYLFLSIFSFSQDAILQSFLLDETMRFPPGNRPEYMEHFANSLSNKAANCLGCCK